MAGAAPDPDDNNEFFKRGRLEHDISFDENSLDGEERQVVQETETIFRTFLYTRLISDIERDSEDGDLNAAEIPGTVIDSIRHEQSDMEKKEDDMENDPKIIELGRILATLGDEVISFSLQTELLLNLKTFFFNFLIRWHVCVFVKENIIVTFIR